ncbi:MAG: glycosyltransferase family 2 protein [Planctomycetota bacterium]
MTTRRRERAPGQRDRPRVTVGVPVFNGAQYVAAALESLVAQTFRDLEIVIVDNGSTDTTPELLRAFAARDARIRVERSEQNRGAAWSHNRVVELARGELFRWATHDDATAPTYVERCVEALDARPDAVMARPRALEIDEEGRVLFEHEDALDCGQADVRARLAEVMLLHHPCFDVYGVVRTEALRRTALIGPYPSSDRVLLAELALLGPWVRVAAPLFLHRQHPERSVRKFPNRRERALWFDPSLSGKLQLPLWRLGGEYWAGVRRARLSLRDTLRCGALLAPWAWRERRSLVGDVYVALRQLLTGERTRLADERAAHAPAGARAARVGEPAIRG